MPYHRIPALRWLLVAVTAALSASDCRGEEANRLDSLGDPLPRGAVARLGRARFRMSAPIRGIQFLSDGERLMSWDIFSTVAVWNVRTGQRISTHHIPVSRGFALSPDERTLASADDTGDVLLIDPESGIVRQRMKGHSDAAVELAFSSDSRTLASSTWGLLDDKKSEIRVWDVDTGKLVRTIAMPTAITFGLTFAAGHGPLFVGSGESLAGAGTLFRWKDCRASERESLAPLINNSHRILVTRDGTRILVHAGPGAATLLDSETGAEKLSIQTGKCWDVAISNRDTELAAISHDALLKRWKLPSGKPLPDLPLPSEGFGALAWSPDDRRIAYSNLNAIHIMELDAEEARVADVDPQTEIRQLTVSTDGRWIAAVEAPRSQRSIRVWERGNDGRFAMSQLGESTESTIGLKLTGDNSLISVSRKGSICEWNVESKAIARTIVETTAMDGAWFSSDGRRLAVTDQQRIQVFDLTTSREVVPPLAKRGYECMNLSPDGTSLIYTSGKGIDERPLKGHRVRNRMRNEIEARDSASRISMSPDGNWIVAEIEPSTFQSERSQVLVANRQTADLTARIDLPREWLLGTAISPDSNLLAAGTSLRAGPKNGHSVGGALWMWHSDGTQVARIPLDSAVTTLAFTADGRWLVTGQKDTTILVWDVAALKSSGR